MAREAKPKVLRPRVALVGDGQTEMIYFYEVKETDRPQDLDIFPDLPSKTGSYQGVLGKAKQLVGDYNRVYAFVDMDKVISDRTEGEYDKEKKAAEEKGVFVLENGPCFEFWLLLHFVNTSRSFPKCDDVIAELKKHIPGYNKSKKFQVAARLYAGQKDKISRAISAAKSLEKDRSEKSRDYPRAEIFRFFEWYQNSDRIALLKK